MAANWPGVVFPSPCGVRRVGDGHWDEAIISQARDVSVPLRGKEGGGL